MNERKIQFYTYMASGNGVRIVEFAGMFSKNVTEPVAFLTPPRPHTSMKLPTAAPRLSTKAANSDKGQVDPGPDVQPGTGTGALFI